MDARAKTPDHFLRREDSNGSYREHDAEKNRREDIPEAERHKKRRVRKWVMWGLVLAAIAGAGIYFLPKLPYYLHHQSTSDAFVTGTIVPVSAQVAGKVATVFITDNQVVAAGDALFQIQRDDYAAAVDQSQKTLLALMAEKEELEAALKESREALVKARADAESAQAQENFAGKENERYARMVKTKTVSPNQFESVHAQWLVNQALTRAARATVLKAEATVASQQAQIKTQGRKIEAARAALETAQINLRRTLVKATLPGTVAQKNVDPGKYVQPGQPVLALVDLNRIWIVANFKETQIKKMRVGQPVDIDVDAYPGVEFKGRVDSLQPGTGAVFSLLPPENATGNFVKIVQRVPVKIVFDPAPDPAYPLYPGLSVVPYVDTAAKEK
ncbi:MAG: HlyD family secretion protein [Desulfobacterales bacterium]